MFHTESLIILLALPFLGSLLVATLRSNARTLAATLSGATTLAALGLLLALHPFSGHIFRQEISWLPELGLSLTLRLNGLSWLFALLILGIGALVILYARYYMAPSDPVPRFFSFLMAFMGAMLGVVLSGNLVLLVFFWELTSIFSFLLIGYWHHNRLARDGARISLVVTAAGGLALLVGILLLGRMAGSYDVDVVLAKAALIRADPLFLPALLLVLVGAFSKSAQFPFHFWLPHAMAAPTPVSAYLHSATMVKAGIYVLMLLWPVFAGSHIWYMVVATTGLLTLLIGAWAAIFQQDLKGLLAYSTISHLGLITLLLGLGSALGAVAAIFHTVNHAIFKASLFMAAGIIDHESGTRDIRRLGGLVHFMPITATLAMVATAAMAGVPLLNGFLSKEMFHAEALAQHGAPLLKLLLPVLATLASTFGVLYSVRFTQQVFLGRKAKDLPRTPHEPPFFMRLPVEMLVLACLVIGLAPTLTIGPLLRVAAIALLGTEPPPYSLAIWHGFNLPLLMSGLALGGGTLLYALFHRSLNAMETPPFIGRLKGRRAFETVLATIIAGARLLRGLCRTQRLQWQLRLLLGVAAAGGLLLAAPQSMLLPPPRTPASPALAFLWLIGAAGAIGTAFAGKFHRLAALAMLGTTGLVVSLTYLWLLAPDLALTQLLVETVTLVLLLLGLRWLPKRRPDNEQLRTVPHRRLATLGMRGRRGLDLLLALLVGGGGAALSYVLMQAPHPGGIGPYFLAHALPDAGGTNVVNVILVDYRALDTLGEITVLAIVATTVFMLLRRFRPAAESLRHLPPVEPVASDTLTTSPAATVIVWLFPAILLLALYLLLRGHDLPGGGFIAGVTTSIAIILLYMAIGTRAVEQRLRVRPFRWISAGLTLAAGCGALAPVFGKPYLSALKLELPFGWSLASSFFFDIGVFLTVVGVVALILLTLAHQSIRTQRAGEKS